MIQIGRVVPSPWLLPSRIWTWWYAGKYLPCVSGVHFVSTSIPVALYHCTYNQRLAIPRLLIWESMHNKYHPSVQTLVWVNKSLVTLKYMRLWHITHILSIYGTYFCCNLFVIIWELGKYIKVFPIKHSVWVYQ